MVLIIMYVRVMCRSNTVLNPIVMSNRHKRMNVRRTAARREDVIPLCLVVVCKQKSTRIFADFLVVGHQYVHDT